MDSPQGVQFARAIARPSSTQRFHIRPTNFRKPSSALLFLPVLRSQGALVFPSEYVAAARRRDPYGFCSRGTYLAESAINPSRAIPINTPLEHPDLARDIMIAVTNQ